MAPSIVLGMSGAEQSEPLDIDLGSEIEISDVVLGVAA
eukprot:CAMPEP_0172557294 /NCGR_PEP_ID=MMETSP1067-20121228/72474_1 /TAXON_ID=265564 ORGANISM="Thalassiosira punctigera, Strain Tpunct2005C2" /NCGR_SAMPLE_ID=MMETSP1067 /ASSEMBLY_ACC=CAM_ASM_000444 /LENGTH=37 /DNA_ID= /DNA_START= /DNA_END= /DNA_ORIENTATION=